MLCCRSNFKNSQIINFKIKPESVKYGYKDITG